MLDENLLIELQEYIEKHLERWIMSFMNLQDMIL